jgi:plasmid stabilization system protein ParE
MAYRVRLTKRAERDLALILDFIHAAVSDAAFAWYEGLERKTASLNTHPNRCSRTPESNRFRHLLYGSRPRIYRVIYRILEPAKVVEVVHIRHAARRPLRPRDIP